MRILVTGNMGYVGPVVIAELRRSLAEATVVGFDIGYFAHCLTNATFLPECRVDVQYFGDVRKFPYALLQDIDCVVHLAAISNDPMGNRYEQVTIDINHRMSVAIAKAARERGVKSFVYASSCSIYGSADDKPRDEKSLVNPLTAYARSKVLTERDLERLADDRFMVTCLRFATACGMSPRLRLDLVLNDFVASSVALKSIVVLSDGTPWRPLIEVRDMARAIAWAVVRDDGGAFLAVNVGSNRWNYQVRDLADAVSSEFKDVKVSYAEGAQPDRRSYKVNFDLFRSLAPDHQPTVSLGEAISGLRKGLESMGFRDQNFRSSQFVRLRVLEEMQRTGALTNNLEWSSGRSGT